MDERKTLPESRWLLHRNNATIYTHSLLFLDRHIWLIFVQFFIVHVVTSL